MHANPEINRILRELISCVRGNVYLRKHMKANCTYWKVHNLI